MRLETEVKINVDEASLVEIRTRLADLDALPVSKRTKEENLLFDFPDRRLEREGLLYGFEPMARTACSPSRGKLGLAEEPVEKLFLGKGKRTRREREDPVKVP